MRPFRVLSVAVVIGMLTGCSSLSKGASDQTTATLQTPQAQRMRASDTNVQLGMNYIEDGDVARAKTRLLRALSDAPNNPAAWYSMGYFYEVTGKQKIAERHFKKAIALNPVDGNAHNNYGTYLCHTKRFREAIGEFERAVQDPNYLNAGPTYENAGLCARFIPNQKLAVAYFKKALQQTPDSPASLKALATYYTHIGNQTLAKRYRKRYNQIHNQPQ